MGPRYSSNTFWTSLPWLAAIQAGVLGAITSTALYAVYAKWNGRVWWSFLHLNAVAVTGDSAIYKGLGFTTLVGAAVHILTCSLLALLFRALLRESLAPGKTLLAGLLFGVAAYFGMNHWVWKRWNPLLVLYAAERPLFVGYLLLGYFLGRYPHYLKAAQRRLARELPSSVSP